MGFWAAKIPHQSPSHQLLFAFDNPLARTKSRRDPDEEEEVILTFTRLTIAYGIGHLTH
jgi:hypothetical protein